MLAYLGRRAAYALPIMLGVALVCFLLVHLAPGDPLVSILPPDASADLQAQLRELPTLYPGEAPFSPDLMAVLDVEDPGDADTRTAWVVAEERHGLDLAALRQLQEAAT